MKRILVPLDGLELAEDALSYARAIAEKTEAMVMLLRVVSWNASPEVDAHAPRKYIDRMVARLRADGTRSEGVLRFGHPSERILESARGRHADLIVMATHSRTGLQHLVLGSVAESVVAGSRVPVLVLRAWQPRCGDARLDGHPKLLVPLDGSPFAEAVLEPAALLAAALEGQLVLLRVEDSPSAIRAARDYLDDVHGRLAKAHPAMPITCEVRDGDAAYGVKLAIGQLEPSIVVMTTHGRTGLRRAILGSLAGTLIRECEVPVVLLGPAAARTEGPHRVSTGCAEETLVV